MALLLTLCRFLARPWTQRVLFAITAAIVSVWLVRLLGNLDLDSSALGWHWLALAAFLNAIYIVGYASCWHLLTRSTGVQLPFRHNGPIWLFSILGKYVPGRIVGIATRVSLLEKRRAGSAVTVAATCVVESLIATTAGLLACTLLSVFAATRLQDAIGLPAQGALALGILAVVAIPILYRVFRWELRRRQMISTIADHIPVHRWATLLAAYALLWMLWGTILVAVVAAIDPAVAFDSFGSLMWIYQLAGITGIVALFTPSGLGAREAVLLAGLLLLLPGPIAALVTVVARIVNVLVEATGISVGYLLLDRSGEAARNA